ncbi:MAG TPA: hypothetical protein PKJ80_05785 [Candidatus Saccharicenans sp.]|nr:hypothetical protein [Candidatus Saccharicenans sp.]
MELFKVTIEYDDLEAKKEWNEQIEAASKFCMRVEIPFPKRLTATTYAAVLGDYGYKMIENAGKVALETIIGTGEDTWEKFGAIVLAVERIGSVGIQEIETKQSETKGLKNE